MTKKDYIKLADCVRSARDMCEIKGIALSTVQLEVIASELCAVLYRDNDRFDEARFIAYLNRA